jgi:hypothetical protein
MPVVITPDSDEAKERAKWEQHSDRFGPPGNPYVYREYPRMLYRARRRDDGQLMVIDPTNEQWSRGSYAIAHNEHELEKLMGQGWRKTQQEALEYAHGLEEDISDAAAHRAYEDRNMSDKAKVESVQVEEASGLHVPEIPQKKRRGRPPKIHVQES